MIPALKLVAEAVGVESADYCFEGRFRFDLGDGWSLVVSQDSCDRLRLDVHRSVRRVASMWCLARDRARLTAVAASASREVMALATATR